MDIQTTGHMNVTFSGSCAHTRFSLATAWASSSAITSGDCITAHHFHETRHRSVSFLDQCRHRERERHAE